MRMKTIATVLVVTAGAAGCSSMPSLPSLPSLPWSGNAAKTDATAESLYAEGIGYFNDKRYTRAIDSLNKIKTDHPFSPVLTDAELKIADAHYLNQQYPEAVAAFKEFQSLHPNNENIPFVVFRLGQAHFDQFTSTDREQKNTEIAKGYFETVINTYPKSPFAAQAREKLAKCNGYLSEYDFNVANFYFQQEKYTAARDRFEEIVRKYNGTPAAEKSLFYLGESYRKEKNNVRASLAYESILQHYAEGKYAADARTQLAQIEKDRQDPLAMLLMRDRRPTAAGDALPNAEIAKPKEIPNLVAKTDIVYEEPGQDKSMLRRVVDKLNPFAPSDDKPPEAKKSESALDLLAKKTAREKEESPGLLSSLWPFGGDKAPDKKKTPDGKNSQLVASVDDSLKAKGVDAKLQTASPKAPAGGDLASIAQPTVVQKSDTGKLLGDIDANLKKGGKSVGDLPPPPEPAEVFRNPAAAQAIVAAAQPEEPKSAASSGLLSSIDQKLKSQGVEPAKFALAPVEGKSSAPQQEAPRKIELEPKLVMEKGPLFLTPGEIPSQERTPQEEKKIAPPENAAEPASREFARSLVKGPTQLQAQASTQKPAEPKKAASGDEENKGAFDQIKQDIESIGKALNPFRW